MTDQEIIIQLKQGNEASLKYVYAHLGMIEGWIKKNNGNHEDALDLFQEAIMVFYKKVMNGTYEQKSKISTYLFSICKRQWLNQLNRRIRHEKPVDKMPTAFHGAQAFETEIDHELPSREQYIRKALADLGEPCKSLLVATVFFKKQMKEVAKTFNYASAHSARQQKLRCLKKLGAALSYDVILRLS